MLRKVDRRLSSAERLDTAEVVNYLFGSTSYKQFFNTKYVAKISPCMHAISTSTTKLKHKYRVSDASSSSLVKTCLTEAVSTTETYELKVGVRNTDRLEVHLKFTDDGRPEVIQLKGEDSRVLTIDVMCFNQ